MRISFYEEFPSQDNLSSLKLVKFPTTVYVAAHSLAEFDELSRKIKKIKRNAKTVYWALLSMKEGYWISPWADTKALKRIFSEIENRKSKKELNVLIDFEFPKNRLKNLLFNSFSFFKNKRIILDFIKNARKNKLKIFAAEYSYISNWLLRVLGLSCCMEEYDFTKVKMLYKKPIDRGIFLEIFRKKTKSFVNRYKNRVFISPGLIARGVSPFEWIATPSELEDYLKICKQENVKEVVIFRLGGLNKDYIKVIEKFV